MDISLIILNYRNKRMVAQCVAHIFASHPSVSFEVIVADNDSQDDSIIYFKKHLPHNVRIIQNPKNGGYSYGNNRAISKSRGRYIMIVNPDIIIEGGAIDELVHFMDAHPSCGIAAPKLLNPNKTLQYSATRFMPWYIPLLRRTPLGKISFLQPYIDRYFMTSWDHKNNHTVESLFGACMIVRRKAMTDVGSLDETFFMYMEDIDWCRRFWKKQWEVWYVATTTVIHFHGRESKTSKKVVFLDHLTRRHIQSWMILLWKYKGEKKPVSIDPSRAS